MVIIFSLAMFLSALLLFLIQPIFAKMVLPLLGGTPAVWNTCMVFYQAVLLLGYIYAHLSSQRMTVRWQSVAQLVLLGVGVTALPISIAQGWLPPVESNPIPWLLALLSISVGLPFFVLSTTAPVLQRWFTTTRHPLAKDPYFLYGASNLGSMVALLGYPIVLEPFMRLPQQSWTWALGYGAFFLLVILLSLISWRTRASGETPLTATTEGGSPPTMSDRFWWIALSLVPSSLLLGVTTYISTDIAAAPLLWVVPLALYLLTFILTFARRPPIPHRLMVRWFPWMMVSLGVFYFLGLRVWLAFPLSLATFFVIAMVCHGELVKRRPHPAHLTGFYLCISVGGVLGGIFNALLAPVIFNSIIEYPLMLAVACLLLPPGEAGEKEAGFSWKDVLLPFLWGVVLAIFLKISPEPTSKTGLFFITYIPVATALTCLFFRKSRLRFALGIGVFLLLPALLGGERSDNQTLMQKRNFFGVIKVKHFGKGVYRYHGIQHGTTLHGAQSLDPARRREPLTYFTYTGPLGQVFEGFATRKPLGSVGIIGLGAGTIACYMRPGQTFTFYEIDPTVVQVAQDPQYFTFLQESPSPIKIILGDARLSLAESPESSFDMIVLDAFSSDAIPLHLITREALRLYLSKLRPGGLLAFHISNRYLDLRQVLAKLASDQGLICLYRSDLQVSVQEKQAMKSPSSWIAMARSPADLEWLTPDTGWRRLQPEDRQTLWSDDFSNLVGVFQWRLW